MLANCVHGNARFWGDPKPTVPTVCEFPSVDSGEEWSKSGEEEVCVCIFLLLYLIYC
jgi:hypothetical protein